MWSGRVLAFGLEDDLAAFDGRRHAQQRATVFERIAVENHDVAELAGLERADLALGATWSSPAFFVMIVTMSAGENTSSSSRSSSSSVSFGGHCVSVP